MMSCIRLSMLHFCFRENISIVQCSSEHHNTSKVTLSQSQLCVFCFPFLFDCIDAFSGSPIAAALFAWLDAFRYVGSHHHPLQLWEDVLRDRLAGGLDGGP